LKTLILFIISNHAGCSVEQKAFDGYIYWPYTNAFGSVSDHLIFDMLRAVKVPTFCLDHFILSYQSQ